MSNENKPGFSLADLRALRLLAVALGIVGGALIVVSKDTGTRILSAGLVIVMMIACPLVIYFLRRRNGGGK